MKKHRSTQIGDIKTIQSAAFQQFTPPPKGVAINIFFTASYRRQAPLKINFIASTYLTSTTYINYCVLTSRLINCSGSPTYWIRIYEHNHTKETNVTYTTPLML